MAYGLPNFNKQELAAMGTEFIQDLTRFKSELAGGLLKPEVFNHPVEETIDPVTAISRFSFRHPAIKTEVFYNTFNICNSHDSVVVKLTSPDTLAEEPRDITLYHGFLCREPLNTARKLKAFVHKCVLSAWSHELGESLMYDGELVKNPHAPWNPCHEGFKATCQDYGQFPVEKYGYAKSTASFDTEDSP